ncbi:hypothetical protein EDWATA_02381, partial [Edwardsiella tarda ATCC 23685]
MTLAVCWLRPTQGRRGKRVHPVVQEDATANALPARRTLYFPS